MKYDEMKNILNSVDAPVDKLEMLMDFGNYLEPVPGDAICHEIKGCSSRVEICRRGDKLWGGRILELCAGWLRYCWR